MATSSSIDASAMSSAEYYSSSAMEDSPPCTPPTQQLLRLGRNKGAGAAAIRAARPRPSLRGAFEEHARDTPTAVGGIVPGATPQTQSQHHHQQRQRYGEDQDQNNNYHNHHQDRYTYQQQQHQHQHQQQHGRHRSSSHELSWSSRNIRASVMDNMLLSLDQLPDGPLSASIDASSTTRLGTTIAGGSPASATGPSAMSTIPTTLFTCNILNYTNASSPATAATTSIAAPSSARQHHHLPSGSLSSNSGAGTRTRGHTFSSSVSSDRSFQLDSPRAAGGRHRSNSSSVNNYNAQASLGRIDSIGRPSDNNNNNGNAHSEAGRGRRRRGGSGGTSGAARDTVIAAGAAGAAGGDGGSNSGRAIAQRAGAFPARDPVSLETTENSMNIFRSRHNSRRRSSSFDHAFGRPVAGRQNSSPPLTMHIQNPPRLFDFDVAPTPAVSVGPRRGGSPARASPQQSHGGLRSFSVAVPHSNAPLERRNSIRPQIPPLLGRGGAASSEQSNAPPEPADSKRFLRSHTRTNSREANVTPQSRATFKRNNVTNLGTPSSSNASAPSSAEVAREKERDRPGFFKRVFGSSRGAPTTVQVQNRSDAPALATIAKMSFSDGPRPDGIVGSAAPSDAEMASPASANTGTPSKGHPKTGPLPPPVLNKKTSFFRRRKKSISEPAAPPVLTQSFGERSSSPVSSLRQLMNPYIDNPRPSEQSVRPQAEPARHYSLATFDQSTVRAVPPSDSEQDQPPSPRFPDPRDKTRRGTVHVSLPKPHLASTRKSENEAVPKPFAHVRTHSDGDKDLQGPRIDSRPLKAIDTNISPIPSNDDHALLPVRSSSKEPKTSLHTQPSSKGAPAAAREPVATNSRPRLKIQPRGSEPRQYPPRQTSRDTSAGIGAYEDIQNPASASESSISDYRSANSKVGSPIVPDTRRNGSIGGSKAEASSGKASELFGITTADSRMLSDEDRAVAKRLFDGDHADVDVEETAAWLGEDGEARAKVRKAYLELFAWADMSILSALRAFCDQLKLKGETQQVDRILDAISTRWCECNPNHGFKAPDVVHTICYSLLLLNTDLHVADIEQKMTRNQFIRNTMPTIRRVVADAAPGAFEGTQGTGSGQPKFAAHQVESPISYKPGQADNEIRDSRRPTLYTRPSDHSGNEPPGSGGHSAYQESDDCGPLVRTPFAGKIAAWETQVEMVLKDFYNSIRAQRLPLSGREAQSGRSAGEVHPSNTSLSAMTGSMLRRTNSMISKAGSETYPRGRMMESSRTSSRWSSKGRSRPRLYPSTFAHSRTSIDDDASALSPSGSSMWSRLSLGKTQTSMSANSLSSDGPGQGADYQQSIGFANALSQAIIREEATAASGGSEAGAEETLRAGPLLEDETLGLCGAPWAKEGMLKHKHHLEAMDKRAKDRSWTECFAVVEKGWMRLFQFNMSAKSLRQKARSTTRSVSGPVGGGGGIGAIVGGGGMVVGGGNWTESAQPMGQYLLRQTIASALPPPGYSKARPHVWALSLPNGAVHLFQAGTPEIVREFVSSANYWSARLSKEPLVGAVSNIEYGWSDAVINTALVSSLSASSSSCIGPSGGASLGVGSAGGVLPDSGRPSMSTLPRPSLQNSIRSSFDQSLGGAGARPRLPGDRVGLSEWVPPSQSMMASQLLEVDQLRALSTYVKNVEEELRKHNELRGAMLLAFTPRHPNYSKAMANWERKSSYLLREIVKFSTYLDCLQSAQTAKEKVYAERGERGRMKNGESDVGASGHESDEEVEGDILEMSLLGGHQMA